MLQTGHSKLLSSSVAKARMLGEPFDPDRIQLFELLYEKLAGNDFPLYPEKNESTKAYQNFAFFEAYFSNYIEGTKFEVNEAKEIVLTETPMPARNDDSHDVLGTYKIVSDKTQMSTLPKNASELIELLRSRHANLLSARKDKNPGIFKTINNRAGNTHFVEWELVSGTLKKGFEWYSLLQHPFAKAAYIMFLVSEVHPFLDGNGRIARIMMNAELSAQQLSKIIVPTVYREDYMGAVRRLTRQRDTDTYLRMLSRIYAYSATIYGDDINQMEKYLASTNAFMEPEIGKLQFPG